MSTHRDRHGDHWEFDGEQLTRIEEPAEHRLPYMAERHFGPFDPPLGTSPEQPRELLITSAVIVQPGDKVLLVMPDQATPDELARFKAHLETWAPGADWLLVAGPEAVYQRPGDTP
jgi:hypothetical protein